MENIEFLEGGGRDENQLPVKKIILKEKDRKIISNSDIKNTLTEFLRYFTFISSISCQKTEFFFFFLATESALQQKKSVV